MWKQHKKTKQDNFVAKFSETKKWWKKQDLNGKEVGNPTLLKGLNKPLRQT